MDLVVNRADVHHVYPKKHLKESGLSRGSYNQIANFIITQNEINIAIGAKAPAIYFVELAEQVQGGTKKYGGITDRDELLNNLRMNCISERILNGEKDWDKIIPRDVGNPLHHKYKFNSSVAIRSTKDILNDLHPHS